jgi:hypothetical protein
MAVTHGNLCPSNLYKVSPDAGCCIAGWQDPMGLRDDYKKQSEVGAAPPARHSRHAPHFLSSLHDDGPQIALMAHILALSLYYVVLKASPDRVLSQRGCRPHMPHTILIPIT